MQDSLRKPQQRTDTPLDFLLSLIPRGFQQPQRDLPPHARTATALGRAQLQLSSSSSLRGEQELVYEGRPLARGSKPPAQHPHSCCPPKSPRFVSTQEMKPGPGQDLDAAGLFCTRDTRPGTEMLTSSTEHEPLFRRRHP